MATWQFALYLLPRPRLLGLFTTIPDKIDWNTFDSVEWWQGQQLSKDAGHLLDSFSERGTHWCEGTSMWGDTESDHVDISAGGDVFARIDVRNGSDKFTRGIIELAVTSDCLLWLPESERLIEPELSILLGVIRESGAFQFVSDPIGFLEGVRTRKRDNGKGRENSIHSLI